MKIPGKVCWLFLLIAGLMAAMPLPVSAQGKETDLILNLIPGRGDYRNEISAGKENTFFLEVRNIGTGDITDIKLSATQPEGWTIEFTPDVIGFLGPNSVQTVNVVIIPASNVSQDSYPLTVIAEASQIRKSQVFYLTVTSASFWIWIGAGVAAAVIIAFVIIYLRLNRQK